MIKLKYQEERERNFNSRLYLARVAVTKEMGP